MEINALIDEGLEGYLETDWLKIIAERALMAEKAGSNVELGLVITTQENIQQLNRTYLGRDEPTDVIAFRMLPDVDETGPDLPAFVNPPDGLVHLGEVIISYPQAVIQAEEQHHSVKREIAILIIHGVLHLLGYKDDTPELMHQMQARQAEVLSPMEGELG
jgi:probable rRNA maturation factor